MKKALPALTSLALLLLPAPAHAQGPPGLVADISMALPATAPSSSPSPGVKVGSLLLFAASEATNGIELYVTDGTAMGTRLVRDINPQRLEELRTAVAVADRIEVDASTLQILQRYLLDALHLEGPSRSAEALQLARQRIFDVAIEPEQRAAAASKLVWLHLQNKQPALARQQIAMLRQYYPDLGPLQQQLLLESARVYAVQGNW